MVYYIPTIYQQDIIGTNNYFSAIVYISIHKILLT